LAFLLLLPIAVRRGALRPVLPHWRILLLVAAIEMAIPWLLLTDAEQRLPSGLTGLLVAHAIGHGSWKALLPAAAFVAVTDRVQIEAEESALVEKFGEEYEVYRAATPRWLGLRSLGLRKPSA